MYFRKFSHISPFSSTCFKQKKGCSLLDESEASWRKTEKKLTFCHKIIATIQKIILSCFRDKGFPTGFTTKFKSLAELPTPAWVAGFPTSGWCWKSSLWPLRGMPIRTVVLRRSMLRSKILLSFLACSFIRITWTLTGTTLPVISFKKLENFFIDSLWMPLIAFTCLLKWFWASLQSE